MGSAQTLDRADRSGIVSQDGSYCRSAGHSCNAATIAGWQQLPIEIVIASTAEPKELLDIANKLVAKAFQSGLFMFADTDLKYDQPQTEIVFDRDKVLRSG